MSFSILVLAMRVRPWSMASRKEACTYGASIFVETYRFASPRDMLALPVGLSSVMAASSLPSTCMFGLARISELLVMEHVNLALYVQR